MRRKPLWIAALLIAGCGSSSGQGDGPPAAAGDDSGSEGSTVPLDGATPTPEGGASDSGIPGDAGEAGPPGPAAATIRVHYPAAAHALTLRGSSAPYSWTTGVALTAGGSDTWSITTPVLTVPLQFKPLLDDATWSRGPNYAVSPGATVDVYPHFTTVTGAYSRAFQLTSTILHNTRGVWVYLPPSYGENTDAKFPVVYMHDGQNLFDPAYAFGGNTWQIGQTMDAAAESGAIAEAIVVGPENTADRIAEYTPVVDPGTDAGGARGEQYIQMLVQELKPKIDSTYRTLPDRDHTFMMGSSLGGLITAYASVEHADVYGGFGALSPSTWWDNTWILGEVANLSGKASRPDRVYVDSGDSGPSNDDVTNTAKLDAAYQAAGFAQGSTLDYLVQAGGQHSEVYWAQRAPGALGFLVGPRALLP